MLPRRAIAYNLDALAEAWEWTGDDVVAHGLPLFHVHGLILGTLGPIRRGGGVQHLGRFSAEAAAKALDGDAQSGWSIDGGQGRAHQAVFVLAAPTSASELHVHMLF